MSDGTASGPRTDTRGETSAVIANRPPEGLVSGQDLSRILRTSPVGISISQVRDGLILEMNDEFLRILGYFREAVIGRTSTELGLWVAPGQREAIVKEFREQGRYSPQPVPMRRRDGTVVTVLFSASPIGNGAEPLTVAWVMDITDRLKAEEELRAFEQRWRALVENAPVTILTVDRSGTILTFNHSMAGRSPEGVIGKNIHGFALGEQAQAWSAALLDSVFDNGKPVNFEIDGTNAAGERIRMQNVFAPIVTGGQVTAAIGVGLDITRQSEVIAALRESEQRLRDIVESMGDWVCETDADGRVTYSSPQVEAVLGYTAAQILGMSPRDTCAPEEMQWFESWLSSLRSGARPVRDRQIWHLHEDGHRVCLSVSGTPVPGANGSFRGYRAVIHDVTALKREEEERRRMEAEVHHARRVESLGVLAGGVAHDFNNLLTAILGNADLALETLPPGDGARSLVEQIRKAGGHAAELTRQMLAYAGRGRFVTGRIDLSAAVREVAQLLASSVPKKIELAFELADGLAAVEADVAQLRQVVMNLVINAADAIGGREGRITVRTGRTADGRAFVPGLVLGSVEPGRESLYLEISDTGAGIGPAALPRIFDPFFTTKFTGRGLGLAAVQGIVLRHRGAVAVFSEPGSGSTFRVLLPGRNDVASPAQAAAPALPAQPTAWRGSGTILLVEDEEPVRRVAARMLQKLGFQVLEACDGREAIEIAATHPKIHAVLLDLTMPRMDGREVCCELRRSRAGLPVVLCSGYEVLESADHFVGLGVNGYLQKPYRLDDLAQALRGVLQV